MKKNKGGKMEALEKIKKLLNLEEPSFQDLKDGIMTLLEGRSITSSDAVNAAFELGTKFGEDYILSKLE
ncbi:MAG: hypothetical protein Q8P07_00265 [bacterium]|nr:hypothetical protein [bacterium]